LILVLAGRSPRRAERRADEAVERSLEWSARRARHLRSVPRWDEGIVAYRPATSLERVEAWLEGDVRRRLDLVREHAGSCDLVFCWLPYLDVVGHLVPTVGRGVQDRAYDVAARATRDLRDDLDPETRLIVVSDHGHRGGAHTHSAFFGAAEARTVEAVDDLTDVYDVLRA